MPATVYSSIIIFVLIVSIAMLSAAITYYVATDVLKLRATAKKLAEHAVIRLRSVAVLYEGKVGIAIRNIGAKTVIIHRILIYNSHGYLVESYTPEVRLEPGQVYFNPVLGYLTPSEYTVIIETNTGDVFSTKVINLDLQWAMKEYKLYDLYPSQIELDVPLGYIRFYGHLATKFGITTGFYGGVFGFVVLDVNGTGDAYTWGYMDFIDYYGSYLELHRDIDYKGSASNLTGSFDAYASFDASDNSVAPRGNYTVSISLDLKVNTGANVRLYTCAGFYWVTIPNGFLNLDFRYNSSSYNVSGNGYSFSEWITGFTASSVNDVWNLATVLESGSNDISRLPGKPLAMGIARCIDYTVDMRETGISELHVVIDNGTTLHLPDGDSVKIYPYVVLPGRNKAYTSNGSVDVYIYPRVVLFFNPEALAISILESV